MKKYQIALSFAGEDRTYVEMVARILVHHGASVFYDAYEEADLWGKNLYDHLSDVYSTAEKFVIMFISAHYAAKVWTRQERRSAQARALTEKGEYILPVRFDDTPVEGLLPTVSYLDARRLAPEEIAHKILEKLGRSVALSKANAVPPPRNPSLTGAASFNFRSYDGKFQIGDGVFTFETQWSGASERSVYCYNDPASIRGVALAPVGANFDALGDVATLDFTSRARCAGVGQFVVLQNIKGYFCLICVDSVQVDLLNFRYWIRSDGGGDFTGEILKPHHGTGHAVDNPA